jgi:hypothetical protein
VIALILQEGQPKAGVLEALDLIEAQGLKIGLATSSRLPWSRRCSANSASRTVSWRSTPPRWSALANPPGCLYPRRREARRRACALSRH